MTATASWNPGITTSWSRTGRCVCKFIETSAGSVCNGLQAHPEGRWISASRPGAFCGSCARVFVSGCLFPPSEGVRFSCVFCSPSEGAQSPGALCRVCARVSVSSCLLPPSEGVQLSRIFYSPSEGAQSSGALCGACARVSVSSCLLPPSEGVWFSRVFYSPSEGAQSPEAL